jgi:hypothetical protein
LWWGGGDGRGCSGLILYKQMLEIESAALSKKALAVGEGGSIVETAMLFKYQSEMSNSDIQISFLTKNLLNLC